MQHPMTQAPWPVHERPMVVIWEATRACQLACRHCRARAQRRPLPGELDARQAEALIDQVARMHPAVFVITGGDPLERADLWCLVRYAAAAGLETYLAPSATSRLTAQSVQMAVSSGCVGMQLSLDGSSALTHDRFRGVRGTFERTLEAAAWCRDVKMPLSIATTVTRENADDLPALATQVTAMGARMWSLFFLVPTGRGRKDLEVAPRRADEILHWLVDVSQSWPFRVKTTEAPQIRRIIAPRAPGTKSSIGDGRGFVFVAYNGDVYPSGFLPITVGNVKEQPLLEIYRTSPLMKQLRDPLALRGSRCGSCVHRALCGGSRSRAYAHTGDPLGDDPLCLEGYSKECGHIE